MNKKKLITMLTALALVGAIGVGATLAYLSAKTQELTNTFTFAKNGIGIELDEATIGDDNKALDHDNDRTPAGGGQTYDEIIPGMEMDKDPTVTITAKSPNCNVFVSVKNPNAENVLKINGAEGTEKWGTGVWADVSAWEEVDPAVPYGLTAAENTKYYVYKGTKAKGNIEENDSFKVVPYDDTNATVLEDVFQTLTVGTDVEKKLDGQGNDITFSDIVIKAAAVQADSCSDYDVAKTALEMLIKADTTDATETN